MPYEPDTKLRVALTALAVSAAVLLSFGLVMVYSATVVRWDAYYFTKQLLWSVLGLGVCVAAAAVPQSALKKIGWLVLAAAVVCLVLVLVSPFGVERNHARRWFGFGTTSLFQPSELAKLGLIVALAWYGDRYQRQMRSFVRGLIVPGIMIGLVAGLVFVEPDFGTGILIGVIGGAILLVAGVRLLHVAPVALCVLVCLGVFMWHNPKCRVRIFEGWRNQTQNIDGPAYQAFQAKLAIGSGGWKGLGIGDGVYKQGFVPEAHTDFILSVIGEEAGLVGTMGVLILFVVLVISGMTIARHAQDTFGMLLAFGITFWIGLQAAINIGVVTSALPNKGLPLPLISYGGSNLVVTLGSIGLLLNVAVNALRADAPATPSVEPEEIAEPELTRC
ncbi:MAG: putative lipid II flippase FtsW [Verrucomicrobiae bacterium]|nr:putative lipid II flippase FtsW [Verrucomicrobiae bacterium]